MTVSTLSTATPAQITPIKKERFIEKTS